MTQNDEGVLRFQWMRNAQGGQETGNRQEIHPLNERLFKEYVKPLLAKGTASNLAAYQAKFPDVTHINLIQVNGLPRWRPGQPFSGPLQSLIPRHGIESGWAIQVEDFDSPEALRHAATADDPAADKPATGRTRSAPDEDLSL